MNKSQQYIELTNRAIELATRWANIVMGQGYRVYGVNLSWDTKTIQFNATPITSGMHLPLSIPVSYFDDDSTLDADAAAFKAVEDEKRFGALRRLQALEKTPEVSEYMRLTANNASTYPVSLYSPYIRL